MLIEIHMIQNHTPSNLNRDDLGAPKTCVFGGVTRARISSQCLKRSIRRSLEFQSALEGNCGIRTRSLVRELARRASGNGEPPARLISRVRKVFEDGGVPFKAVAGDPDAMKIVFFVPESDIQKMADAIRAAGEADLAPVIAPILRDSARVPDIALSGRMTEFKASGALEHIDFTVEAALQAAHAISTHSVVNEVDYWTAADDLPSGQAAAMIEEAMFSSACFYKYFSLDWDQLVRNLGGVEPDKDKEPEARQKWKEAERIAACTLGHFIRAAAENAPTGKQNAYASHTKPSGILVEIKKTRKTPTNYANAFAEPAERIGKPDDDAPDYVSRVGRSISLLGDHIYSLRNAYGIRSTLLWHAEPLYRYPLQGWQREPDGRRKHDAKDRPLPPVPFTEWPCPQGSKHRSFASLGGNTGEGTGLIEGVIEELGLGLTWAEVMDAGKMKPQGAAS